MDASACVSWRRRNATLGFHGRLSDPTAAGFFDLDAPIRSVPRQAGDDSICERRIHRPRPLEAEHATGPHNRGHALAPSPETDVPPDLVEMAARKRPDADRACNRGHERIAIASLSAPLVNARVARPAGDNNAIDICLGCVVPDGQDVLRELAATKAAGRLTVPLARVEANLLCRQPVRAANPLALATQFGHATNHGFAPGCFRDRGGRLLVNLVGRWRWHRSRGGKCCLPGGYCAGNRCRRCGNCSRNRGALRRNRGGCARNRGRRPRIRGGLPGCKRALLRHFEGVGPFAEAARRKEAKQLKRATSHAFW